MLLEFFTKFFLKKKAQNNKVSLNSLKSGDLVKVFLKEPHEFGIQNNAQTLTHQRLDEEDLNKRYIEGFVVRIWEENKIQFLEMTVVKNRNSRQFLIGYVILDEEIKEIKILNKSGE